MLGKIMNEHKRIDIDWRGLRVDGEEVDKELYEVKEPYRSSHDKQFEVYISSEALSRKIAGVVFTDIPTTGSETRAKTYT
jgi:hypothetical protein